uniref:Uncharacterized protein n=1 Tax=Glycine max TaxID=3847 RepID=C6TFN7_SOYBN|nr:unknown [Glycine max]
MNRTRERGIKEKRVLEIYIQVIHTPFFYFINGISFVDSS